MRFEGMCAEWQRNWGGATSHQEMAGSPRSSKSTSWVSLSQSRTPAACSSFFGVSTDAIDPGPECGTSETCGRPRTVAAAGNMPTNGSYTTTAGGGSSARKSASSPGSLRHRLLRNPSSRGSKSGSRSGSKSAYARSVAPAATTAFPSIVCSLTRSSPCGPSDSAK